MDKQSREILVGDAIARVRNRLLDQERCQICGEPSPITISKFVVAGEDVQSEESMCENCYDNVRCTIHDMEEKLNREHCY